MDVLWTMENYVDEILGVKQFFAGQGILPEINMDEFIENLAAGHFKELSDRLFLGSIQRVYEQVGDIKHFFLWLLAVGIVSAVLTLFCELFDRHQVADLGFYMMYLSVTSAILQCFEQMLRIANQGMGQIVQFVKLMLPVYMTTAACAGGGVAAGFEHQILLILIVITEELLSRFSLQLVFFYLMLGTVNGLWAEERFGMLMELVKKGVGLIVKGSLGIVTGIGLFQAALGPVLEAAGGSVLRKAAGALPGVGNTANTVMELIAGSAQVMKSSVGVFFLVLLLCVVAAPLLYLLVLTAVCKAAAAIMGIVSDKRISEYVNCAGETGFMLFQLLGTSVLLFFVSIAIAVSIGGRV